jgi:hypothetical protein
MILPPLRASAFSAIKSPPLGSWSLGFSWDLDFDVWDFDLSPSVFTSVNPWLIPKIANQMPHSRCEYTRARI